MRKYGVFALASVMACLFGALVGAQAPVQEKVSSATTQATTTERAAPQTATSAHLANTSIDATAVKPTGETPTAANTAAPKGTSDDAAVQKDTLSTWFCRIREHKESSIAFAVILLAIVVVTGVLLYFAGRKPDVAPRISKLSASFFFWLGIGYLVLLLVVAVFYNLTTALKPLMFGGVLPAAVPWFGALGAVVISLEGIFFYGQKHWDKRYNYWHIGRPLFGAVLGIVAFFIFVLIVGSSGTMPPFLADPAKETVPKDFIVYYVVAFLVGYREETFRELIRRVTDMILKPGTAASAAPAAPAAPVVTFKSGGAAVSMVDFDKVAAGQSMPITIDVENTGSDTLISPSVSLAAGSDSQFNITLDQVTNSKELKPGESKSIQVTLQVPTGASEGSYTGTLTVSATNLSVPAKLQLSGKT